LDARFYLWRNKFGGMEISDAKRLKALESEKLLAESMLENEVTREVLRRELRPHQLDGSWCGG
jgi:putative transposase